MSTTTLAAEHFLALHVPGRPLVMGNPWDVGSALVLENLGMEALGTTSAGFAGTRGRGDGRMSREEALAHAGEIASAVTVPVSADLENGFGDSPETVAETVRRAAGAGLAGCSIEDWDPVREETYPLTLATERIAAAAEAARADGRRVILTARADAAFHGESDLDDAVRRLVAFAEAGADVVYAPAYNRLDEIRSLVEALADVDGRTVPLNVLALADAPSVGVLASAGVARISTGSGLYWAAMGGLVRAARELLDEGSYRFWRGAADGRAEGRRVFG